MFILFHFLWLVVVFQCFIRSLSWFPLNHQIRFRLPAFDVNILTVIDKVGDFVDFLDDLHDIQFDMSAGSSQISTIEDSQANNTRVTIVYEEGKGSPVEYIRDSVLNAVSTGKPSPLLRIHKFGRRAIKGIPDDTLLGILVLIASELLQRELSYKAPLVPTIFREIANTTITELDSKLQLLSQLSWDFDPFLQKEFDNLQSQPLEAIDRFLVTEVLPRLDKELSPILPKLATDPAKLNKLTKNIKELGQMLTYALLKPSLTANTTMDLKIVDKIDDVGKSMEEGE